ncbi:MAG TPA: DUF262 domain-containing protein [Panacibacter sp.]|nr:DUF262 domain-containing protein [Panacibacter sp.]
MSKVNLDALIPREDFAIIKDNELKVPSNQTVAISELEHGKPFLKILRKPDFQRETNEWTPEKVCELILSFLNDDLIPSIILWSSGSRNFVIDGAHRLSALISWVIDDYGDGVLSSPFFGHKISPGQVDIAEQTKKLVKKKVGTYQQHLWAVNNPTEAEPEMLKRSERLPNLTLQLQWVKGNADKAEDSFFKINEEAAPINETERTLLKSRNKPNTIAARAIVRSGTGHKYWSVFESVAIKEEIETLAKEINSILFRPELETPVKTLDVPLGGKGYSSETLSLVFDVINVCNSIEQRGAKKAKTVTFVKKEGLNETVISDDTTGEKTIEILKKTRKILYRICADHPSSLGLHPQVYFYSMIGRYQITSFLAIIEMIKGFEIKDDFHEFLLIRKQFEDFILKYKIFVNQSTVHTGSGLKGYKHLKKMFTYIIEALNAGKEEVEILESLLKENEFNYLNPNQKETENTNRKDFSTETKSAVYLSKLIASAMTCEGCKGYMHINSATIDHKIRKQDGGKGNFENGGVYHPYCNTTEKN